MHNATNNASFESDDLELGIDCIVLYPGRPSFRVLEYLILDPVSFAFYNSLYNPTLYDGSVITCVTM